MYSDRDARKLKEARRARKSCSAAACENPEYTDNRDRAVCASGADRHAIPPNALLHRAARGNGAGGVCSQRDAIAAKEVVAMGHIILSNRERPIILEPLGLGLRAMTLRYAHDCRHQLFRELPAHVEGWVAQGHITAVP